MYTLIITLFVTINGIYTNITVNVPYATEDACNNAVNSLTVDAATLDGDDDDVDRIIKISHAECKKSK